MSQRDSSMGQSDPLVIVGTGLAGYTVARELRKLDGDTPLVIVSRDDGSFYSKPALSNALAMKKAPSELANSDAQAMAAKLRAQIWTYRQVERIVPVEHAIVVRGSGCAIARWCSRPAQRRDACQSRATARAMSCPSTISTIMCVFAKRWRRAGRSVAIRGADTS